MIEDLKWGLEQVKAGKIRESMSRIHNITIREANPSEFIVLGRLMIDVYSQLQDFPSMDEQPDYYKMLANIGDFTKKPDTKLLVAISPES